MKRSPPELDPVALAEQALGVFGEVGRFAYALLAPDLSIRRHSPGFPAMIGRPNATLVGEAIGDVLWEFVGADGVLAAVLDGDLPQHRLEHINRELDDGSIGYVTYQVTRVDPEKPEQGLFLLVEDTTAYGRLYHQLVQERNELRLTRQKLARANEELNRLNQMKSLFLSMAAHDLRTPLSAIYGYADLMSFLLPAQEQKLREYVAVIQEQAERLRRLILDLLSLDQIERATLAIEPAVVDLREGIAEVLQTLDVEIRNRGLEVTVDTPERPLYAWVDPKRAVQILYNLIGNAVKYTPDRGQIRITAQQKDGHILFEVADSGPGLTEEQLANLFTLYYRTKDARRSKITGTGLGLFIVKTLVEAHGGQIDAHSHPGDGSVFAIELPVPA